LEVDLAPGELLPAPAVEHVVTKAADDAMVGDEPGTYRWTPGDGRPVHRWRLVEELCGDLDERALIRVEHDAYVVASYRLRMIVVHGES
jgi:hypothetical protein